MPALPNTRHERFAQELAKGKSQAEAYEVAGYQPSRSAASRLADDVNICARVAEIADRVAIRTEITAAAITDRLLAIAAKAEKADEAPMLSVARAALMDAAKLNGLVIDRSESGRPGDFDRMTDDELADYVRGEAAALGIGRGSSGASAQGDQAGVRRQPSRVH